jgi:fructoselysine-6-P-deglycase FrlB-like protein
MQLPHNLERDGEDKAKQRIHRNHYGCGFDVHSCRGRDGPVVIFINDETLASTRELVDRLRQIGQAVDSATGSDLDELDEEAAEIDGILSDLLVSLLVDAGLVEPLVVSEDS